MYLIWASGPEPQSGSGSGSSEFGLGLALVFWPWAEPVHVLDRDRVTLSNGIASEDL